MIILDGSLCFTFFLGTFRYDEIYISVTAQTGLELTMFIMARLSYTSQNVKKLLDREALLLLMDWHFCLYLV